MKQDKHIERILKERRDLIEKYGDKFPVPDDLEKGDKVIIIYKLMLFDYKGKFKRYLMPDEQVKYLGRRENNKSNIKRWIILKDFWGVNGIVNPIGMINCFKYVEEE
jgi:hypothetical protein